MFMLIAAVIKLNGENLYKTCFINYNQMLLYKGVVWNTYVYHCLYHAADQNQLFRKLSNCLEGVNSRFLLARFSKTSSETCLSRLALL